jgi:hypothetical protein
LVRTTKVERKVLHSTKHDLSSRRTNFISRESPPMNENLKDSNPRTTHKRKKNTNTEKITTNTQQRYIHIEKEHNYKK